MTFAADDLSQTDGHFSAPQQESNHSHRYENIKDTEDKKFSTAGKVTSCLDVVQFSVDFNYYINELPILEYRC